MCYWVPPQYNIEKLQRLQNMACRIVKRLRKYDHVSEALKDLHWLPIHECIVFKTCMIMYKCITGSAPLYLQELVITKHNRKLGSSSSKKLPVNRCRTSMVQNSSFSSMGPRLWNLLPYHLFCAESIELFKSGLKTFLFNKMYN